MEFYKRTRGNPAKLAIFPGAFNPPTIAHIAMAEAALTVVDEVLFVLPRAFPHKEYTVAGFGERLELLRLAIDGHPGFSLAASDRGLFIDLAREARVDYGADTELFLLCGRDAAERIVGWDYRDGDSIEEQLRIFRLLVASRDGSYAPPPHIETTAIDLAFDEISSSEVRRRIEAGGPWRDLVPRAIVPFMESHLDLWSRG